MRCMVGGVHRVNGGTRPDEAFAASELQKLCWPDRPRAHMCRTGGQTIEMSAQHKLAHSTTFFGVTLCVKSRQ